MRIAKPSKAYLRLRDELEIDLGFTSEQKSSLEKSEKIILSNEQLDYIVDQFSIVDGIEEFLIRFSKSLQPLSLSLFVINDRLWEMMKRKSWDKEKMLAMSTIPLCAWDKKSEKTSNVKAVKRWTVHPSKFEMSFDEPLSIKINGEGGDFSGFIEQSQLTARKFGLPETRKIVPNYLFEKIDIHVLFKNVKVELYPKPRDDLDYDYSDNARVFYEHGFSISVPGENVTLKVGKRRPTKMLGDVYLLLGKRIDVSTEGFEGLMFDIWLRAMERRMN